MEGSNENAYAEKLSGTAMTVRMIREAARRTTTRREDGDEDEDDESWLFAIRCLDLSWKHIGRIDHLEIVSDIEELRLQHNRIRRIEGLDALRKLTFLSLSNNRIREIRGLKGLHRLRTLDLSNNRIASIDDDENIFPNALVVLDLSGNPLADARGAYREDVLAIAPPGLKYLDGIPITPGERCGVVSVATTSAEENTTRRKMVDAIFKTVDADGDGRLNLAEASALSVRTGTDPPDVVQWTRFCAHYSADPSIGITVDDLAEMYDDDDELEKDYAAVVGGATTPRRPTRPATSSAEAEREAAIAGRQLETALQNFERMSRVACERAKSALRDAREVARRRARERREENPL